MIDRNKTLNKIARLNCVLVDNDTGRLHFLPRLCENLPYLNLMDGFSFLYDFFK